MEIVIILFMAFAFYVYLTHEDKQQLQKINEAMKKAKTEELKLMKTLIDNELEERQTALK